MAELTSLPGTEPVEFPDDDSSLPMPTPSHPSQPFSSTSAAAAGTLDSSAHYKERRHALSIKRHHDDPAPTSPAPASTDADAPPPSSPPTPQLHKRQRTDDPTDNSHNDDDGDVADLPPPPFQRSLSTLSDGSSTDAPSSRPASPVRSRRGSMTEDEKRASFALALAKALAGSVPSAPSTPSAAASSSRPSSPSQVQPQLLEMATSIESAVYARHAGLSTEYTIHLRDLSYNLLHNERLRTRLLAGQVDVEEVASAVAWKAFADKETKKEREEAKQEDLVDHLAPEDVTPGILPNAHTTDR